MGAPARGWAADTDAVAHVFVDALDDLITIDGADGHHLQRVRRVRAGEPITAADGTGAWRGYVVDGTNRGSLGAHATSDRREEPERTPRVAVAVALLKGGLDDVVARLTELGVDAIEPVRTQRTVVRWDAARERDAVARLREIARGAAMQSRRA
ncbi:MAG TPA: RsmE family RNA methyltransferase, partial [Acidimicrobiia bacterium]|nr:RsmE family RNA methyltransferase [Acidimicrobiia bacterium]